MSDQLDSLLVPHIIVENIKHFDFHFLALEVIDKDMIEQLLMVHPSYQLSIIGLQLVQVLFISIVETKQLILIKLTVDMA